MGLPRGAVGAGAFGRTTRVYRLVPTRVCQCSSSVLLSDAARAKSVAEFGVLVFASVAELAQSAASVAVLTIGHLPSPAD